MAHDLPDSVTPSLLAPAMVEAAARARIGVVVTVGSGSERRHEFVSSYAAELVGLTERELEASIPSGIFPEERRAEVEAWRDLRLSGRDAPRTLETELCRGPRDRVPVRISASRAASAGRPVLVEFVMDARESRQAEIALSRSEARFKELIDAAPEAVVIGVTDGIAYANPAALALLAFSRADDLARISLREHVHPDDLAAAEAGVRELMLEGVTPAPLPLRLKRRDGRFVDVEIVALSTEWDNRPAVLAIGRDLGERRQLQAQLVQADRLAAVGTLAAGVAHEINNPLAYVLLNLEYLLRELPKLTTEPDRLPRLVERLAEARHGAERVSSIVQDLRAFSREDRDERGSVDLRLVLTSAAKVAEPEIRARGRLVEKYEHVPPVCANGARLEQVFLNLLINAAQALPASGGEGEVRASLFRRGESVIVEIADNGAGIPPELLDRVFDPFFSTKPIGAGTGLGLPICHSIVTSLGGEISVHSEVGKGSVFRVSLPILYDTEKLPTPAPISPPVAAGVRARVLVIDDELPVASMLSRVLADQHDVRLATSARDALELLAEQEFDVVLCDLLMPGMSGMDLHRELATLRPGSEERMVFMTGGAFTPRAAEFLARVKNPRIEKPFDLSRMRRIVHELTERMGPRKA